MNLLITGASGFVGKQLQPVLEGLGHQLLLATRSDQKQASTVLVIGNIDDFDEWDAHLSDIDVIIHLAACVHQMGKQDKEAYQRTNVDATTRLADAAIRCGVKRFIFFSTIKVNGENTDVGQFFTSTDAPSPMDAYSSSKLQAELELKALLANHEMELVVIRPPLVYGPDVKGNFLRLVNLASSGLFLPLSGIQNHQDMVSVDNLCELIAICIDHPRAVGKTFLVSDGIAYSTADIIRSARLVSGLPIRLFYLPPILLKVLLNLVGKKDLADKLFCSLEVDMSDTIETLDWTPKYTLEQTLGQMLS